MDRNVKMGFAVASVVASVLMGVNFAVTPQTDANLLVWGIVFAGLALFLWLWLLRDDRRARQPQQVLEHAEKSVEETARNAQAIVANVESAVRESEPAETIDKDAAFEAGRFPEHAETAAPAEAPLPERAKDTQPPPEQVLEEANAGEPLSSAQVAEAEAKKPLNDTDLVVDPGDDPESAIPASAAATEDAPASEAEPQPAASAEPETPQPPAPLPPADEPDDLTRIEGIGPKYRDALIEMGYDTFDKLAALTYDQLLDVIQQTGMRKSASMETWVEQAKLAAAGEWEALDRFQEDLKSGRRS